MRTCERVVSNLECPLAAVCRARGSVPVVCVHARARLAPTNFLRKVRCEQNGIFRSKKVLSPTGVYVPMARTGLAQTCTFLLDDVMRATFFPLERGLCRTNVHCYHRYGTKTYIGLFLRTQAYPGPGARMSRDRSRKVAVVGRVFLCVCVVRFASSLCGLR
jgi:hypothetical protein